VLLSLAYYHVVLKFFSEICSVIEKKSKDFKPCIFPFNYLGVSYNNCTIVNDPDDNPWCSTKVDEEGNHVKAGGYWGHCGQDCEKSSPIQRAEFAIATEGVNSY